MKYVSILLVSIAAFVAVEAEIPDYIHTCKRNDPQLNQCIQRTMMELREKFKDGIPELKAKKSDPLAVDELVLNLGAGISAVGKKLKLTGLSKYQVTNVVADIDANTFSFDMKLPGATVDGLYEIEAKIASIPLRGKGPIHMTAKSVFGRTKLYGKKVVRHGKTRLYFASMDLKLELDEFKIKLKNLFEGAPEIGAVMNSLLNQEQDEVLKSVLPSLEKKMIVEVLDYANKMVAPFVWDELFPES